MSETCGACPYWRHDPERPRDMVCFGEELYPSCPYAYPGRRQSRSADAPACTERELALVDCSRLPRIRGGLEEVEESDARQG